MNSYEKEHDKHRKLVNEFCQYFSSSILHRGKTHDYSKTLNPERKIFEQYQLQDTEYGTEEYRNRLVEMKQALNHHYSNNRHHPEHFENGIEGMNLIDLVEMLSDWLASIERHKSSSVEESLLICKERFNIGEDLYVVLCNTVKDMQQRGNVTGINSEYGKLYSRVR